MKKEKSLKNTERKYAYLKDNKFKLNLRLLTADIFYDRQRTIQHLMI